MFICSKITTIKTRDPTLVNRKGNVSSKYQGYHLLATPLDFGRHKSIKRALSDILKNNRKNKQKKCQ